jgi:processing peptidase subunit alpha
MWSGRYLAANSFKKAASPSNMLNQRVICGPSIAKRYCQTTAYKPKERIVPSDQILNRQKKVEPSRFSPLETPHKGIKNLVYNPPPAPNMELTTLPNGIRIATEQPENHLCTIGIGLTVGLRDEAQGKGGALHLLERMVARSTATRSSAEIVQTFENLSINPVVMRTREYMWYHVEFLPENLDITLELLSDTLLNPIFLEQELDEQRAVIQAQLEELSVHQHAITCEVLHDAAYGGVGLAHSVITASQNITRADVLMAAKEAFVGEKLIFVATGIQHNDYRAKIEKLFGHLPQKAATQDILRRQKSPYIGGFKAQAEFPSIHPPPPNHRPVAHVAIGFEAPTYYEMQDYYAACVLQSLLGGGNAFSSGGPGKGMHSKLYVEVLCKHTWVESCIANIFAYAESGIFAVVASAHPDKISELTNVMVTSIINMTKGLTNDDLMRAKNQLNCAVTAQCEQRIVNNEDMVRQVFAYNKRYSLREMLNGVENVTLEDIKRVAKRMLVTKPTVVAYGPPESLRKMPKYDAIERYISNSLIGGVSGNIRSFVNKRLGF